MMGLDMMLKSLGLNPEDIKKQAGQIGQFVADLNATAHRIEIQNRAIMAHFGIADPTGEQSNGPTGRIETRN